MQHTFFQKRDCMYLYYMFVNGVFFSLRVHVRVKVFLLPFPLTCD